MKRLDRLSSIGDCTLIVGEPNLFYFLGYEGVGGLLYSDGVFRLIVPTLELNRASQQEGVILEVYGYGDDAKYRNLQEAVGKFCTSVKADLSWMSFSTYSSLKAKMELQDISRQVSTMRAVKDGEELSRIRKAGEITSRALEESLGQLKEGMTERQFAGVIDYNMKTYGASDYAFQTIVAFSENSAYPHHIPTNRQFRKGDLVLIDVGAKYEGYCFDTTRTILTGSDEEQRKVYEYVLESQLAGIDAIRDGSSGKEADSVSRSVLRKYGVDRFFYHSLGHGVGIEIHEHPSLSPLSNDIIGEGMVVTSEPGVYYKDRFGIRIEDTVIVGKNTVEVISVPFKGLGKRL